MRHEMEEQTKLELAQQIASDLQRKFTELERKCLVVIGPKFSITIMTLGTKSEYSIYNALQMHDVMVHQHGFTYAEFVESLAAEFEVSMICEDIFMKYYAGVATIMSN